MARPASRPAVRLLDQTGLPAREAYLICRSVPQLVEAIRRLAVRGAPLLGVAGAYGVALAACRGDDVATAATALAAARPTAVNLGWGVDQALRAYQDEAGGSGPGDRAVAALRAADAIARQDAEASDAMGEHGLALVPQRARILTHCNTGALVSAGQGTAFAVILAAHRPAACATCGSTRPVRCCKGPG